MKALLAAATLTLTMSACSSSHHDIRDVAPVGSFSVMFVGPDDFDQSDREEVVEAVERHASAWQADFHKQLPATKIVVLDKETFTCSGVSSIGCTSGSTITVVRGSHNDLVALYHEFCHRGASSRLHGTDGNHLDPAWQSWTERSVEIANDLVKERSWLP